MAPMQTVQLLGREGRHGFLQSARAHVAPRGLVAIALADALETFDAEHVLLPLPDTMFVDGAMYSSQPVGLRDRGDSVAIERIRTILRADGHPQRQRRRARAGPVTLEEVEAEGRAAGLEVLPGPDHRPDRGARRHDRGDAPWLSRPRPRCASARCIPTS